MALFVVISAVVLMMLAVGAASGEDAEGGTQAGAAEADPTPVRELPGRRTATSNTFLLSDGQMETRLFEVPVNYRDEDGDWEAIGEELAELPGGALTNGANSFDVHLPEDLNDGPIQVDLGEEWVSEMTLGVETSAADLQPDGTASYSAAGGSAGFEFNGLANGLKESIELAGPEAPSTYRFRLDASAGVAPVLVEDGSIAFRDQDGTVVAEMPAPSMMDNAGAQAPASAIHYALEEDGEGAWELAVEADSAWLQAEDRSWPVVIDPTVKVPSPALDCLIATTSESQMCGTTGYSYLTSKANYPSAGEDTFARSLLRFNLTPSIPANAYLTSATIGLYSAKTATNITKVDMYDVSRSWLDTVSWRWWGSHKPGKDEWAVKGGEFGKYMPTPTSLTPAERGGSGPGPWNFSSSELTWLVQRWLGGVVPNNGVLLKLADETPHVCCFERRVEWESSAGAEKPYLSVQYIEPASPDSKITSPSDGTKTAKRFLLTSAWEHSGVSGVTFQYMTDQGWKDIPGNRVIDGNNQTVTWPESVKSEDRQSKPLYWDASNLTGSAAPVQIRALLSGSVGAGGYTKPVAAEVNKEAGGLKDGTTEIGPGSVDLLTGNLSVARTDVSIAAFNSTLEFSRTFNSRQATADATGVLGPGWKPASPVEEAGGASWGRLVLKEETEQFEEGGSFTYKWAELTHSEGGVIAFEESGGQFITPDEMSGYVLYRLNSSEIAFTDPEGNRTVFSNNGSGSEYLPKSVAMTGGPGNKSRMIYEVVGSKRRLFKVIAPAAPGISCPDEGSSLNDGCRLLVFSYQSATAWGAPESAGARLSKITYYASGHGGPWDVAQYGYNTKGQLTSVWDPRVSPNLKETYSYLDKGQIGMITPPGQSQWQLTYMADEGVVRGRLKSVRRASLVESNPTAQTTIAYNVPLFGSGAPYSMSGEAVAAWGQEDLPTDATAIFPPDEVPAESPSSYTRATVYYMDAEGQVANVATPSGAGTTAPAITTTETDSFGNVIRELGAQNRLRALTAGAGSAAKSRELDTQFGYSKDGSELQEEVGPTHQVRLESGTVTQARLHRSIQYDKGAPSPQPGEPMPHQPTTETTGALLGNGSVVDKRSTEYRYNWTLRKQTETIADPEGAEESRMVTVFDSETGLTTETRQPSNAGGGGAGTTRIVYYEEIKLPGIGECESDLYAGLPCKIEPAAQPGTSGQPNLRVTKYNDYNQLGQPEEMVETVSGSGTVRKTLTTYDAAGREKTSETIGGGVETPKIETLYSGSQGLPTSQRFICPEAEPGCDTQTTSTAYDSLGRVTSYQDADGVTSTTSYDFVGRPITVTDGKGTQTYRYDSVTGLQVELEDSAAGLFTASYDADGNMTKRGLPNGLSAEATFDETGQQVGLAYTKTSSCGLSCNWLDFSVDRSIRGQVLRESSTFGQDEYGYDKLGRLVSARETPTGGNCTTRTYQYDKDSNRVQFKTSPGVGSVCTTSGGSTQNYSYDSADRLLGSGLAYDSMGRITNLPASMAGGNALATTYFSNDMVATQTQAGVTNTYQLDATLRQRQRLQAGGLEGTEIFHYSGPSDSMSWTQRGSAWTRNILGIGGELAAIQEAGKEVELQLGNMNGDVVAAAALNPGATELKATFNFDEFGNQTLGTAGHRYGWLGGKLRPTELASGVVQMGARSYVPQVGRFLSTDPVPGGSANPYDYAYADPVNNVDLDGQRGRSKPQLTKSRRAAAARPARVAAAKQRRSVGSKVIEVIDKIKKAAGMKFRIAWGTCIPRDELSIGVSVVTALFGTNCIPKTKARPITNAGQIESARVQGLSWCFVINAFLNTGTPMSVALATLRSGAFCGAKEERQWAYVKVPGWNSRTGMPE